MDRIRTLRLRGQAALLSIAVLALPCFLAATGVIAEGAADPHATSEAPVSGVSAQTRQALIPIVAAAGRATAYSTRITLFERLGDKTSLSAMDFSYRGPSDITAHVISGRDAGATIVWTGGSTVEAHRGSGLMAMFTKKFSLHDPVTTSLRGGSIDQLRFAAIVSYLQSPSAGLHIAPEVTANSVADRVLTFIRTSNTGHPGEINREEFQFSADTHLPKKITAYDNAVVLRQVTFSDTELVRS